MCDSVFKYSYYLPILQVIVLITGTLVSVVIAYAKDDISIYLPFISETGAFVPESCIFSFTLNIGSFLGILVILCYYIILQNHESSVEKMFKYLNNGAAIVGLIAMIGLSGVSAFPMTTVFSIHLAFASMYFLGCGVYFALITALTYKTQGISKLCIIRAVLCIMIMVFLLLIVILFPIALGQWREYNSIIPAKKTPDQKGFTLLLFSSVLEWSIVIIIIIFTLSLVTELKKFCLEITASNPNKNTIGNDGAELTVQN